MWLEVWLANYDRLQVVLSYDTDNTYSFRCLPWILSKKYCNRYIFKGKDGIYTRDNQSVLCVENEVYLWKVVFPLFQRQLLDLFRDIEKNWEDNTFNELSYHAQDIARSHNLFQNHQSHIQLQLIREFIGNPLTWIFNEMLADAQKQNHTLSLVETVRANTLLLLWY